MTNYYNTTLSNNAQSASANKKPVAIPPEKIPAMRNVYNNKDADIKMQQINQDIYEGTSERKSSNLKSFVKLFGGFVLGILAYLTFRKFIR